MDTVPLGDLGQSLHGQIRAVDGPSGLEQLAVERLGRPERERRIGSPKASQQHERRRPWPDARQRFEPAPELVGRLGAQGGRPGRRERLADGVQSVGLALAADQPRQLADLRPGQVGGLREGQDRLPVVLHRNLQRRARPPRVRLATGSRLCGGRSEALLAVRNAVRPTASS